MNFKTTIALIVLLIAGGVGLWLTQPKPGEADRDLKKDEPERKTKYVFDPQPDSAQIVRAVWERPGKPRVVWERSGKPENPDQMDDWRFVEPIKGPTENYVVDGFVSSFGRAQSRSAFEPGKEGAPSAKDAGFDALTATITLVTKDNKEYKLEVGKKAALSDDTYVRIAGAAQAHRVDRDLVREATKDVKDFRSKRLVSSMPQNAKSLRIEVEGKTYAFSKDATENWVIDEPVKDRATKSEIEALARNFNSFNVDEFVADAAADPAKYGLDKPYMRCTLVTETKKQQKPPTTQTSEPSVPLDEFVTKEYAVEIGAFADMKESKRYARLAGQPWIVSVATGTVTQLTPNLRKLRDARVTHIKAADATELELTMGDQTASLKKVNNQWSGEGDLAELDAAAVTQVVTAVEDLTALDFVDEPDPAKSGLGAPRGVVKLTARGAVAPIVVKIGANTESGRNSFIQIEGRSGAIVVDSAHADKMLVSPLSLRSRDVFATRGGRITSLDVTRGSVHYALEQVGGQWKLSEPAGAAPDANGVADVTRDLTSLRARKVVAKDAFDSFGFKQPSAIVKFTVQSATSQPASAASQAASAPATPSEHTLVVARTSAGPFCRIDESPYIFEVDESIYRTMTGELIDRKLLNVKESDIVGVAIDAPGGKLLFKLDDAKKWTYEPDPYVPLAPKKMREFVTEISTMRVEEYLAYSGGDLAAFGLDQARLTVTLALADGKTVVIKADSEIAGALPRKAALPELGRVFLLRPADIEKLIRPLDYYVKPDSDEKKTGQPGIPGQPEEDDFPPPPPDEPG